MRRARIEAVSLTRQPRWPSVVYGCVTVVVFSALALGFSHAAGVSLLDLGSEAWLLLQRVLF
ncbi:MAG: hypothetical protein HRU75_09005 [Planctomycetia bacterium]|nr:MAG: hypothetical protein HRU75_09005 [Planctomycetia bacterium]